MPEAEGEEEAEEGPAAEEVLSQRASAAHAAASEDLLVSFAPRLLPGRGIDMRCARKMRKCNFICSMLCPAICFLHDCAGHASAS